MRIYTEYRISHKTLKDKEKYEQEIKSKADALGLTITSYIKLVTLNSKIEIKSQ